MWLLLVEDEKPLANSLKRGLEEEGYVVDVSHEGEEARLNGMANDYDLVILDRRLPGMDGKTILQDWRGEGRSFPVLMLTALNETDQKIEGLDAGADDYMGKPFSFEELLARIRALSRRADEVADTGELTIGVLTIDSRRHTVTVCDEAVDLRNKEFIMLELFMHHPDTVYSKTQLAERIWGSAQYISDNAIEVTLSTLRKTINNARANCGVELPADQSVIETIRGAGYRLNEQALKTGNDG